MVTTPFATPSTAGHDFVNVVATYRRSTVPVTAVVITEAAHNLGTSAARSLVSHLCLRCVDSLHGA